MTNALARSLKDPMDFLGNFLNHSLVNPTREKENTLHLMASCTPCSSIHDRYESRYSIGYFFPSYDLIDGTLNLGGTFSFIISLVKEDPPARLVPLDLHALSHFDTSCLLQVLYLYLHFLQVCFLRHLFGLGLSFLLYPQTIVSFLNPTA